MFKVKVYYQIVNLQTNRVKRITQKSGALDYSQKMAKDLVEKGKRYTTLITQDPELNDILLNMADFMIERKS